MSPELLSLFLILCCSQFLASAQGEKRHELDVDLNSGKGYHGVRTSGRHMDEQPEYETEKGVLIREKRAPANTTGKAKKAPSSGSTTTTPHPQSSQRTKGFIKVYTGFAGGVVFLGFVNVGMFIWLSITLKKVRKP